MKRDYATGSASDVIFFTGIEVERTPAYNTKTLFVTGVQNNESIGQRVKENKHIFFGANHSFSVTDLKEFSKWEAMIMHWLNEGYMCSLDIPPASMDVVACSKLLEHNLFIPQIRLAFKSVNKWNKNTMVKIDDVGFNVSNPGVWTHSLDSLKTPETFTNWNEYLNDTITE